jgi:N-acetyl-anhydromuramyl-L-alanine amidase AmpD
VLPDVVLDMKFNVLHMKEEEIVHHYIVAENGEYVELSEEELEAWNKEG